MKASKFSDAQKAFIIKQGGLGTPVAEICRKAGISQGTYFNWKKEYVGLMPSEMKRLREMATEPNDVWAMDFVHDQLATGQKLRVLTIVDTYSRYVPVLDPKFRYRGEDVVATLERVCGQVGYPKTIRVDQGSEFI